MPGVDWIKKGWSTRTEWIILGVVSLGGLALRLYVIQFHPFVDFDGAFYINYFRDRAWQGVFHPGYPLLIELFRLIISDGFIAARMVSVVFGTLIAIPLFYLARHFMNPPGALAATIIVVLNPLMIRYSALPMSEMQFIFLELLAFLCYVRGKPLLFGIVSGLAYLTRPEAVVFFVALALLDLWKKRNSQFPLRALLGFLLLALPYVIYLRVETGAWTMSPKTVNLREWETNWHANLKLESPPAGETPLMERWLASIKGYPERMGNYIELLSTFAGIPLCLLGVIGMVRAPNILLAGMLMFLFLPLFGLSPYDRFVLPYIPFLGVFALLAIERVHRIPVKLAGFMLILVSYFWIAGYVSIPEDGTIEYYTAGIAMRPMTHREDVFLDRKPYTAFYAGGRYVEIPNESVDSILSFGRRIQAKYLVVSGRVTRTFRPQLTFVLYNDSTLNRLHLQTVYVADLPSGYGVRILQLPE